MGSFSKHKLDKCSSFDQLPETFFILDTPFLIYYCVLLILIWMGKIQCNFFWYDLFYFIEFNVWWLDPPLEMEYCQCFWSSKLMYVGYLCPNNHQTIQVLLITRNKKKVHNPPRMFVDKKSRWYTLIAILEQSSCLKYLWWYLVEDKVKSEPTLRSNHNHCEVLGCKGDGF